jgi:hypothetical protein
MSCHISLQIFRAKEKSCAEKGPISSSNLSLNLVVSGYLPPLVASIQARQGKRYLPSSGDFSVTTLLPLPRRFLGILSSQVPSLSLLCTAPLSLSLGFAFSASISSSRSLSPIPFILHDLPVSDLGPF